ncbi:hypothetical protein Tco_0997180 [Tanacetum coccineum]
MKGIVPQAIGIHQLLSVAVVVLRSSGVLAGIDGLEGVKPGLGRNSWFLTGSSWSLAGSNRLVMKASACQIAKRASPTQQLRQALEQDPMDINKMTDTLADCSYRGKIESSSGRLRGSLLGEDLCLLHWDDVFAFSWTITLYVL